MSLRIKINTIAQMAEANLRKVEGQQNNVMEKFVFAETAKSRILNAGVAKALTESITAKIKAANGVPVFVQANMSLKNVKKLIG